MGEKEDIAAKSAKNVGVLVFVQVFQNIITFVLNLLIARIVAKEVFGYANIQMQLYISLVLWFAKESARKTVQRKIEVPKSVTLN